MTVTEAARQPVVLDPYDYALHEDPYPVYARLRSEAPLYHNAHYDMERLWNVMKKGLLAGDTLR